MPPSRRQVNVFRKSSQPLLRVSNSSEARVDLLGPKHVRTTLFVTLLASCVIAGCAARQTWVLAPGQHGPAMIEAIKTCGGDAHLTVYPDTVTAAYAQAPMPSAAFRTSRSASCAASAEHPVLSARDRLAAERRNTNKQG